MSRRFDFLVAEHVMGYSWYHRTGPKGHSFLKRETGQLESFGIPGKHPEKEIDYEGASGVLVPPYAKYMAATWPVVETMKQVHGWYLSMYQRQPNKPRGRPTLWYATFINNIGTEDGIWPKGVEPEPQIAICVAALKAVGVPTDVIYDSLGPRDSMNEVLEREFGTDEQS